MKELLRWQVGDVRITRVQELEAPDIRFVVPDATVENLAQIAWLGPFRAPNGHALASVHTLILEAGERRIPIIAITAAVLQEDRDRCRESGMDDFLAKPVTHESVEAMLDRWIGDGLPPDSTSPGARADAAGAP